MLEHVAFTRVSVRAVEVEAFIGIYSHEIGRSQPLVVAVTLEVDQVDADNIEATTDYRLIVDAAAALGRTEIALIETFAYRLARYCLTLPGVRSAEVTIDKPQALPIGMASVTTKLCATTVRSPSFAVEEVN